MRDKPLARLSFVRDNQGMDPSTLLIERLSAFVRDPTSADFATLAREAFTFQFHALEPYRRLCLARGAHPESLGSWREIPPIPVAAFKTLRLCTAEPVEIFRSSGTTSRARSVHYHPFPELYRQTLDIELPRFCLPWRRDGEPISAPMLSLVPTRQQIADSSLGFMVEHVMRRFGGADCRTAFSASGVDSDLAASWCRARSADSRPGLILATAFALVQWLEHLEEHAVRFQLPTGSVVFETGGFKGRVREIERPELLARLATRLGIPAKQVVREYGMSELTGQFYTRALDGGDVDLFVVPHFMRVRLLDPLTLEEAPTGQPGLIAILDLTNVGSALHLLTEDLGIAEKGGFRLLGRAKNAELRGCSLTVEELERSSSALPS